MGVCSIFLRVDRSRNKIHRIPYSQNIKIIEEGKSTCRLHRKSAEEWSILKHDIEQPEPVIYLSLASGQNLRKTRFPWCDVVFLWTIFILVGGKEQ